MALHLNLYHEIQKQKRERQRDPLRLGLMALGAIVAVFVLYYVVRLGQTQVINSRLAAANSEWMKLEPKCKQADSRIESLTKSLALGEALTQRIENRFYWAPVLDRLLQAVPSEVQLSRFDGGVVVDEKTLSNITIAGNCVGKEPRKVAEELRTSLTGKMTDKFKSARASFQALDDAVESAQLDGKSLPTASFIIRLDIGRGDRALAANNAHAGQNRREEVP
jgi:hypothetical protein